ncbi:MULTISPECIES: dUTP diphosphatase [Bacillus cereus group]|nr:dUTP diphosphatase [Bacillus cereus]
MNITKLFKMQEGFDERVLKDKGLSREEIERAYIEKNQVNHLRQDNGY